MPEHNIVGTERLEEAALDTRPICWPDANPCEVLNLMCAYCRQHGDGTREELQAAGWRMKTDVFNDPWTFEFETCGECSPLPLSWEDLY